MTCASAAGNKRHDAKFLAFRDRPIIPLRRSPGVRAKDPVAGVVHDGVDVACMMSNKFEFGAKMRLST